MDISEEDYQQQGQPQEIEPVQPEMPNDGEGDSTRPIQAVVVTATATTMKKKAGGRARSSMTLPLPSDPIPTPGDLALAKLRAVLHPDLYPKAPHIPIPSLPPPPLPSHTLYVRNLSTRYNVHRTKAKWTAYHEELVNTLFRPFGPLVGWRARRSKALKGQAFITFRHLPDAIHALESLNGYMYKGKPILVQFSRDQNYKITHAKHGAAALEAQKQARAVHKQQMREARAAAQVYQLQQQKYTAESVFDMEQVVVDESDVASVEDSDAFLPPNAILFLKHLPSSVEEDMLVDLFSPFPGFKEVRLVPGKKDIAFVEFETESFSAVAKEKLHGHVISSQKIKVTFAKK